MTSSQGSSTPKNHMQASPDTQLFARRSRDAMSFLPQTVRRSGFQAHSGTWESGRRRDVWEDSQCSPGFV